VSTDVGRETLTRPIQAPSKRYVGALLAFIFIDLAFILLLYRKEFLPDVMIVKKRRRKWEDLYVREEDKEGEGIDTGGLAETLKRAVYPYYRK